MCFIVDSWPILNYNKKKIHLIRWLLSLQTSTYQLSFVTSFGFTSLVYYQSRFQPVNLLNSLSSYQSTVLRVNLLTSKAFEQCFLSSFFKSSFLPFPSFIIWEKAGIQQKTKKSLSSTVRKKKSAWKVYFCGFAVSFSPKTKFEKFFKTNLHRKCEFMNCKSFFFAFFAFFAFLCIRYFESAIFIAFLKA